MRNYTLVQLAQGLRNLLDERRADLAKSAAGKYHAGPIAALRAEIDALPPALTGGLALSDELKHADDEHDGYGASIYFNTESVLRLPDLAPEVKAAAQRVRDAFVPSLAELRAPYVVEAHRAVERRPLLVSRKADLEMFPVVGGGTLLAVATKFLDCGERLDTLLDRRGGVPKADRSKAAVLRARAVGLVNRLRDDLAEEIVRDTSLPRDLEHRVFGYLDTIAALGGGASTTPATPAAPGTPPTPA
jgi:hypothetical protein